MRIQRIDGRSDVLGEVRVRLPGGLVAVVGRGGRTGPAFVRLLRRGLLGLGDGQADGTEHVALVSSGSDGSAAVEDLTALRLGAGGGEPGDVLEASARALARVRGAARIDEAFQRVVRGRGGEGGVRLLAQADPAALRERIEELEGTPDRLRDIEGRLRELRADHAEVAGDMEVAAMEWLRERQDAETHLQAYRDRARELKGRLTQLEEAGPDVPCPTCGRVLDGHFDDVVSELREEWESVVQDGSWWKRRREQLELKPEPLRELEGRSLRLQASIEECAEDLERARARVHELRSARERLRELEGGRETAGDASLEEAGAGDPASDVLRALTGVREAMVGEARAAILVAARRMVLEMSGGRLLGLSRRDDGSLALEGVADRLEDPTPEDRATATVAVRLGAVATLLKEEGTPPGTVVVGDPFDRMDEESALRTVGILVRLLDRMPHIILVTRGRVVDLYPEAFDAVLELAVEGEGRGPSVRSLAAGVGSVRIE